MSDSGDMVARIRDGAVYLIALILSICVHEFGHAFVGDRLGDPLPRAQGRVTLNPLAHIDPIGTLLMPILGMTIPGAQGRILGWGKPVQVSLSARHLTRRFSIKISHLFIAAAGPMMNLVFAVVLSAVFAALVRWGSLGQLQLALYVSGVIQMNIGLAFFNLIPCPPLDGGAILRGVLPRDLEYVMDPVERYGFIILLALLSTGLLAYLMIPARIVANHWLAALTAWATSS